MKPADWDEREYIVDPEAKKPDDWDESAPKEILDEEATKPADWLEDEEPLIPDPKATQPEDWDEKIDGEWEPKKIPNLKCEGLTGCGKWVRPMKPNPQYKVMLFTILSKCLSTIFIPLNMAQKKMKY